MTNNAAQFPIPDSRHDLQETAGTRLPRAGMDSMAAGEPDIGDDAIDLREFWHILRRYKGTIALIVALSVALALVITFNVTPLYKASTLLQIDRVGNRVVEYGDVTGEVATRDPEFYTTQYELLQSRTLARRVIDQVGLQAIEESKQGNHEISFIAGIRQAIAGMIDAFGSSGRTESREALSDTDRDHARLQAEENLLLENLMIEPVRNSRLVRVEYQSPYPVEAAAIANAIASNFINLNLERRYDASAYAKQFLEEQLQQTKASLEESETRFVAYARERQIVNFEDRLEILRSQLRALNSELVTVEAERIEAEAEYQELLEASPGGAPRLQESELVRLLKDRRNDLKARYQQKLEVFKPGYPEMQELQRQIREIDAELARETTSIRESVRATFEAKVREEVKLRQRVQEVKEDALLLQDRTTDYEVLKREVETNRELYDGLLQRVKEVGVAAGVGENNISIIDTATVPLRPFKPDLRTNLAIALVLGLCLGAGVAFLLNMLDDTIKSADEIEQYVGAPVLGLIPHISAHELGFSSGETPLLAFRDPKSSIAEAARSLRTSLLFATPEGAPRIMHFTSSGPGEGKTTTATSTAIAFAQAGDKVLLIDGDLRNPSLHRAFGLPNTSGLTNHLAGNAQPVEIAQPTQILRLFTITSGPLPPNPVELLSTQKMVDLLNHSATRFDRVIVDGPPVIGLADALMLANLAKATIFVVEPGITRTHDLKGAVRRLRQASAHIMGAVLTKVGRPGQSYGYSYGYGYSYDYFYSYGGKGDHPVLPQQET